MFAKGRRSLSRRDLIIFGAVLIEDVNWCGKTRTAIERAKSAAFMRDPDNVSWSETVDRHFNDAVRPGMRQTACNVQYHEE
jgi:hypothetical protein